MSHADKRVYPFIRALTACENASGGELKSENDFLAVPAKYSVKFLVNFAGSGRKSRPSIGFVTLEIGGNSADFLARVRIGIFSVESDGWYSSDNPTLYLFRNPDGNSDLLSPARK